MFGLFKRFKNFAHLKAFRRTRTRLLSITPSKNFCYAQDLIVTA